jgi:hypothetical protein
MMIAQRAMVHYSTRLWLETTAVTKTVLYTLIIRPMH